MMVVDDEVEIGINSQKIKVQTQVKPVGMVCGQDGDVVVVAIDDDVQVGFGRGEPQPTAPDVRKQIHFSIDRIRVNPSGFPD